ncbi:histidine kinase dimerization/phosphoacceptor domain -containing protein [Marinoscillum furvescens]|uniref:histidine kinase n=1 Tax=Marinoscillum furvescens DSM 4134 TaxID=1122208 RepID=A0A3D9LIV9_MARFU|nr:histidine kinase dimerization/phosphoacceptor domain -containing protein [Marinoscillum furvescens]REE05753.1 two-component sensor histidine kinase [Marinoscillum furvescens DSM 4134]
MIRLFTAPVFLFFCVLLFGQNPKLTINQTGVPPIHNFKGVDYGGFDQVWDIAQDDRGLIYLAASYGIHEYDGETWRTLFRDRKYIPRRFKKNNQGRIYVSGVNVAGYLAPDSSGHMAYHAFQDLLPKDTNIGAMNTIEIIGTKVYFFGITEIYSYDEVRNELTILKEDGRNFTSFTLNEQPYFFQENKGLCTIVDEQIQLAPHRAPFEKIRMADFVKMPDSTIIGVNASSHELILYQSDTSYTIPYGGDPFFKDKLPYRITRLSKDYFAINYLTGGVRIVDNDWNTILHLNEQNGLCEGTFQSFLDAENNLWVGSNMGCFVIDLESSITYYNAQHNVSGYVVSAAEDENYLYFGSTTGIHRCLRPERSSLKNASDIKFEKIAGSDIYVDDMVPGGSTILARGYQSIGQVIDNQYEILYTGRVGASLFLTLDSGKVAITTGNAGESLEVFRDTGKSWKHTNTLKHDDLPIQTFDLQYNTQNDRIWAIGHHSLYSFQLSPAYDSIYDIRIHGTQDGLPTDDIEFLEVVASLVYHHPSGTFYEYQPSSKQFQPYATLPAEIKKTSDPRSHRLAYGIIKYYSPNKDFITYDVTNKKVLSIQKMGQVLPAESVPLHATAAGELIIGASESIGIIAPEQQNHTAIRFPATIRRITLTAGTDSVVFSGMHQTSSGNWGFEQEADLMLNPHQNNLRIQYACPYYKNPAKRSYSTQLLGFDSDWSEWTQKTEKEYTNLPAGSYSFLVKAKNGFGEESKVGRYNFTITPPWHQTAWAYGFYTLLFGGFIYGLIHLNGRRLKAENVRLEGIISERTSEILEQKTTIEKALQERESLLKEIHHRVKNNLQIIASLLYLQSGIFENADFKKVLEEGQGRVRSMALIHQKLYENEDLKSIPFGEYLDQLLGEIKASFGAQASNIEVEVESENIYFDVEMAVPLGLIVNELATNAFKYAFHEHEQGRFSISLQRKSADKFVLQISDNGRGLPEEIDIRKTKSLGLRLVKMLSTQLEGDFKIESKAGTHFELEFAA